MHINVLSFVFISKVESFNLTPWYQCQCNTWLQFVQKTHLKLGLLFCVRSSLSWHVVEVKFGDQAVSISSIRVWSRLGGRFLFQHIAPFLSGAASKWCSLKVSIRLNLDIAKYWVYTVSETLEAYHTEQISRPLFRKLVAYRLIHP